MTVSPDNLEQLTNLSEISSRSITCDANCPFVFYRVS